MDQTLHQLGELLLGSIPTVILVALLYALYVVIVHKPLRRVLEERRSKTEGAVENLWFGRRPATAMSLTMRFPSSG